MDGLGATDVQPSGKIVAEKDEGLSNCYQFTIQHEDHTLGNLLTQQLLTERRVLFAGYRIHHPLNDWIYMRVNVSDNISSPADLVKGTIEKLVREITDMRNKFERQVIDRQGQDRR